MNQDLEGFAPGNTEPPAAGPTAQGALYLLATNVSRIAGLSKGCADGMEISSEVNRLGVIGVLREIQSLADALLPPLALLRPLKAEP